MAQADVGGLPVPGTPEGRAGLEAILSEPGTALIAMDFDGTLSPIVADPREARAHPGAVAGLRELAGLVGTLAGITGRPAGGAGELGGVGGGAGRVGVGGSGWEGWGGGGG